MRTREQTSQINEAWYVAGCARAYHSMQTTKWELDLKVLVHSLTYHFEMDFSFWENEVGSFELEPSVSCKLKPFIWRMC
jgi:hypothetical protein